MLLLTDFLKLHEGNEAEKFLKPWWDLVIHYFILVLVMVAVVCGVVGLIAPAPVCIPVVNCTALGNSSLDKKEICAKVSNTSQKGEDAFHFATLAFKSTYDPVKFTKAAVKFSNRNLYDYINSECGENIYWMVRFFPNVLLVMAGVCLVCSNVWFVLKSSILDQFTDLLRQCYKYRTAAGAADEAAAADETGAADEAGTAGAAREKHKNRSITKMKKFLQDLNEDNTCLDFCSLKGSYFFVVVIQTLVVLVILSLLAWLIADELNGQYECNIDGIILDQVYDTILCSYSISKFYQLCAGFFGCFVIAHLVFSIHKLVYLLRIDLNNVNYNNRRVPNLNEPMNLGFLLNLVKLSNRPYLNPFCRAYREFYP